MMKLNTKTFTYSYENKSDRIQVIRLCDNPGAEFERTLAPGQSFVFEAASQAKLEVCTHHNAMSIVCDRIPCRQLTQADAI